MRLFEPGRSRAVLVGIGDYQTMPPLHGPARNRAMLADVLQRPDLGRLPESHCWELDHTADTRRIGEALADAGSTATDMLLFYFAGHGTTGRDGTDLFLALGNTDEK